MRKLLVFLLLLPLCSTAQQFYPGPYYNYYNKLGIGTGSSVDFEPNAWLQLGASGRPAKAGIYFYPINRTSVLSPKQGMIVCDASDGHFYRWDATAAMWIDLSSTSAETDPIANAKTITITAGTGIGVVGSTQALGTNPTFTINNTSPDQIVTLTGIGGVSITGTYPDFTIAGSGSGDGNNYTTSIAFNTSTGIFTLGRFGMADLTVDLDGRYIENEADPVWSSVAADYYTKTNLQTSGQAIVHWGNITSAPPFITSNQTITLSGDVTGSGATSITTTISSNAVTYAKMQDVTSQRIMGRYAGTMGDPQEIQIGTGLNLNTTTGILTTTGVLTESDPIWTAAIPNYYTKTNLQTSGQSAVHWGNLTNIPSAFPTSSDLQVVTTNGRITNIAILNTHANILNSSLYNNGNYEANSSIAPSYGFHRPGLAGMALYLGSLSESDLRIRTSSNADYYLYHTGNMTLSESPIGSTVPIRNSLGYLFGNYFNSTDDVVTSGVSGIMVKAGDNYIRTGTATAISNFIGFSGDGNYIKNQNSIDQTANARINGDFSWGGRNSGNPRAVRIGWTGGEYGSLGYNVTYSTTPGTFYYALNDHASDLVFQQGGFSFRTAPSGSAGNPITLTEKVAIKQDGSVFSYKSNTLGAGLYGNANFIAEGTNYPAIGFHKPGLAGAAIYLDNNSEYDFRIMSSGGVTAYIWNSANDGSGSGLDADYVDGVSSERIVYGDNNSANLLIGAGGDLNFLTKSGFYNGNAMLNAPTSDWYNVIHSEHSNHGGYANQIAQKFTGSSNSVVLYARTNYDNTWGSWQELWHSGNKPFPLYQWTSYIGGGVSMNVNDMAQNTTTFSYADAGTPTDGPVIAYGGFNNASYQMQVHGSYQQSAGRFYMRTRNGDISTWNPWRELWHTGNFDPASYAPVSGGTGYIWNQTSGLQTAGFYIGNRSTVGGGSSLGSVSLAPGSATFQGYVEFNTPGGSDGGRGVRKGYIGFFNSGMNYSNDDNAGHIFRISTVGDAVNMRIGGIYGNGIGGGIKSYSYAGMIGDYDQNGTASKIIWTIGDGWNTIATMYGIGYTYTDLPGTIPISHNIVFAENGGVGHTFSMNGKYMSSGDIQTGGQIRAKGWYSNFGDGSAAEMGYSGGSAQFGGYNRTSLSYIPTSVFGSQILLNGLTNSLEFNSNASVHTYGSWYVIGTVNGWTGIAHPSSPGNPTWMFDTGTPNGSGGLYYQGTSLWALYYNSGSGNWHINTASSSNVVLHTGNHAPGSAFNVVAGSNEVIESVVSNASGHVTNVTKKTISAIPTLTSSSLTAGTSAQFLNAYWAGTGCSLQPVNNAYLQSYGGTKIATLQACIAITHAVFGDNTRRVIATVPSNFWPVVPIKWTAGSFISADYCLGGVVSSTEFNNDWIQYTLTTAGEVICELGATNVTALFSGVAYRVLPIQITYAVSPAL